MAKLIATRSILHQNRLYEAGEELPQHDAPLVCAWLGAGSAKMEESAPKSKAATTSGKTKAPGKKKQPTQ